MPVELHTTEAGRGQPLVLLHAFPLSSAMWELQRAALRGTCRVLTADLRGFGRSPLGGDEPSLDHMADDLAALLDDRGIDQAVVGGVSMGGYVVMALLRRHPARVRAALLADTKASADAPAARENRERIATTVLAEGGPRVLLDDVLPTLVGRTTVDARADVLDRVRKLVAAAPPAAVAWAQRAMAARPDSFATLRSTAVPVLVVVGEEDTLSPPSDAEAMVEALPDARLVRVPCAGHLAALEAPEAFNDAVRDFVAALPARS